MVSEAGLSCMLCGGADRLGHRDKRQTCGQLPSFASTKSRENGTAKAQLHTWIIAQPASRGR